MNRSGLAVVALALYYKILPEEILVVHDELDLMPGCMKIKKGGGNAGHNGLKDISEKLDLNGVLDKKAGKLSGGWQRRVSIAMALISEPEVLFLDEPTLGLDVLARSELWELIQLLKGKVTIILTTHYMEEAEALSDRIGIMKNGKMLAIGTADELMKKTETDRFENAFIKIIKEGMV